MELILFVVDNGEVADNEVVRPLATVVFVLFGRANHSAVVGSIAKSRPGTTQGTGAHTTPLVSPSNSVELS